MGSNTLSDIAIRVENLGKQYKIGRLQKRHDTLRDQISDFRFQIADLVKRRNGHNHQSETPNHKFETPNHKSEIINQKSSDSIWALRDVSFEVKRGEVVGIIGRNGAGKSTLLKILSRITEPTTGAVDIYGRVASLLEVGTGFHPELTGRENIFLNGAILGMRKTEIEKKFDEIVAFAEVEKFIDTPVKRYSSGMYVRLAFAVAAHLEPEILLVDEVLAVGDAAFQKKCLGKMGDVAREGRTVLFVSHNMSAIRGLCKRALWVDAGQVRMDSDANVVVGEYLDFAYQPEIGQLSSAHMPANLGIEQVILRNEEGQAATRFRFGENITIEIHYNARERIPSPYFWIAVDSQFGSLFGASMLFDNLRPQFVEGRGILKCIFQRVKLLPQAYTIWLGARDQDGGRKLVQTVEVGYFRIEGTARDLGMLGEYADTLLQSATPLVVDYEWHFNDGTILVPNWTTWNSV